MLPNTSITDKTWLSELESEFDLRYMKELLDFLESEKRLGKTIYPESEFWFNAFNNTPFDQVRAVIIGQDPYHGSKQAHGLCFSVQEEMKIPPSLRNIFKEIERDLGTEAPLHGCLRSWARQGVFLLNATLTVEHGLAGSHQGKGWEKFTDVAIQRLSDHRDGIVFLLWGSYAQKKGRYIDGDKHLVLNAPHPSPLSAHRGFIGCNHFSQINQYLQKKGEKVIDWRVS
ncbi:MAG: uracil-DNA glycosylase [Oceanicoccus sp.]|jgi:uracil-DNA glycosylase